MHLANRLSLLRTGIIYLLNLRNRSACLSGTWAVRIDPWFYRELISNLKNPRDATVIHSPKGLDKLRLVSINRTCTVIQPCRQNHPWFCRDSSVILIHYRMNEWKRFEKTLPISYVCCLANKALGVHACPVQPTPHCQSAMCSEGVLLVSSSRGTPGRRRGASPTIPHEPAVRRFVRKYKLRTGLSPRILGCLIPTCVVYNSWLKVFPIIDPPKTIATLHTKTQ